MPKLLFFSRVAFICNLCFIITLMMEYIPFLSKGFIGSTIIIIGLVLSIVINVLVNSFYLLLALSRKQFAFPVPKWLIIVNFLFLILQAILLIK